MIVPTLRALERITVGLSVYIWLEACPSAYSNEDKPFDLSTERMDISICLSCTRWGAAGYKLSLLVTVLWDTQT